MSPYQLLICFEYSRVELYTQKPTKCNEWLRIITLDSTEIHGPSIKNDLQNLTEVVLKKGTILCDDYNLSYAPGVKKAIDEYVFDNGFNIKILNERFAEIKCKDK